MTLENQLQQILGIKQDIKSVLNDKGLDAGDDFSTYVAKIEQIQGGGASSIGSAFNLFDTKLADHILEGDEALGWALQGTTVYKTDYPDFYERCLQEYNNSTLLDNIYTNNNGHKFYDISYKSTIDAEFEQTGSAWMYGIDQENECIFLPRNIWFEQAIGNTSEVGQSVEAGLPNITGTVTSWNGNVNIGFGSSTGTFSTISVHSKTRTSTESDNNTSGQTGFSMDASKASPVYGKSNTVQPAAVKKLLYICVGNTVQSEVVIDLSKEIELNNPFFIGQSQYFEVEPNNLSWLKSDGSYHTKDMYPSMYEYILENVKAGTKDFVDVNGEVDDYCYVLDQENETFRLPLLNGSESLPSDKYTIESNFTLAEPLVYKEVFIAPANGWYIVKELQTAAGTLELWKNGVIAYDLFGIGDTTNIVPYLKVYCKRGDVISAICNDGTFQVLDATFRYAQGNGSLYYFMGETVQKANLINIGNIEEKLAETSLELQHKLNDNQITNCLLEVPQNIKLELNDGVLTLKAGSKVIVPNGFEEDGLTPKFDYVTIDSDISFDSPLSEEQTRFMSYSVNNKILYRYSTVGASFDYNTTTNTLSYAGNTLSFLLQ